MTKPVRGTYSAFAQEIAEVASKKGMTLMRIDLYWPGEVTFEWRGGTITVRGRNTVDVIDVLREFPDEVLAG